MKSLLSKKLKNIKNLQNKKNRPETRRGFTIVETLVAIFILVTVITGTFAAVQTGLSSTITAKNQIKAFYLTQEVSEIIRNKRDSNYVLFLKGTPTNWLSGIADVASDPCFPGKTCIADAFDLSLTSCGDSGWNVCDPIRQSSSSHFYGYDSGWDLTGFTREVQIEKRHGVQPDPLNLLYIFHCHLTGCHKW